MDVSVGREVASSSTKQVSKAKFNKCIQTRKSYLRKRLKGKLKQEKSTKQKTDDEQKCRTLDKTSEEGSLNAAKGERGAVQSKSYTNPESEPRRDSFSSRSNDKGRPSNFTKGETNFGNTTKDENGKVTERDIKTTQRGSDSSRLNSELDASPPPKVGMDGGKSVEETKPQNSSVKDTEDKKGRVLDKNSTSRESESRTPRRVSFASTEQNMTPNNTEHGLSKRTDDERVTQGNAIVSNASRQSDASRQDEESMTARPYRNDDSRTSDVTIVNTSSARGNGDKNWPLLNANPQDKKPGASKSNIGTHISDSRYDDTCPSNPYKKSGENVTGFSSTGDGSDGLVTTTCYQVHVSKINQDTQTNLTFPCGETTRGVLLDTESMGESRGSKSRATTNFSGCSVLNTSGDCVVLMSNHTCTLRRSSVKLSCMSEDEVSDASTSHAVSPSADIAMETDLWEYTCDAAVQTDSSLFDAESICISECSSLSDFTDIVESSPVGSPRSLDEFGTQTLLYNRTVHETNERKGKLDWVQGKQKLPKVPSAIREGDKTKTRTPDDNTKIAADISEKKRLPTERKRAEVSDWDRNNSTQSRAKEAVGHQPKTKRHKEPSSIKCKKESTLPIPQPEIGDRQHEIGEKKEKISRTDKKSERRKQRDKAKREIPIAHTGSHILEGDSRKRDGGVANHLMESSSDHLPITQFQSEETSGQHSRQESGYIDRQGETSQPFFAPSSERIENTDQNRTGQSTGYGSTGFDRKDMPDSVSGRHLDQFYSAQVPQPVVETGNRSGRMPGTKPFPMPYQPQNLGISPSSQSQQNFTSPNNFQQVQSNNHQSREQQYTPPRSQEQQGSQTMMIPTSVQETPRDSNILYEPPGRFFLNHQSSQQAHPTNRNAVGAPTPSSLSTTSRPLPAMQNQNNQSGYIPQAYAATNIPTTNLPYSQTAAHESFINRQPVDQTQRVEQFATQGPSTGSSSAMAMPVNRPFEQAAMPSHLQRADTFQLQNQTSNIGQPQPSQRVLVMQPEVNQMGQGRQINYELASKQPREFQTSYVLPSIAGQVPTSAGRQQQWQLKAYQQQFERNQGREAPLQHPPYGNMQPDMRENRSTYEMPGTTSQAASNQNFMPQQLHMDVRTQDSEMYAAHQQLIDQRPMQSGVIPNSQVSYQSPTTYFGVPTVNALHEGEQYHGLPNLSGDMSRECSKQHRVYSSNANVMNSPQTFGAFSMNRSEGRHVQPEQYPPLINHSMMSGYGAAPGMNTQGNKALDASIIPSSNQGLAQHQSPSRGENIPNPILSYVNNSAIGFEALTSKSSYQDSLHRGGLQTGHQGSVILDSRPQFTTGAEYGNYISSHNNVPINDQNIGNIQSEGQAAQAMYIGEQLEVQMPYTPYQGIGNAQVVGPSQGQQPYHGDIAPSHQTEDVPTIQQYSHTTMGISDRDQGMVSIQRQPATQFPGYKEAKPLQSSKHDETMSQDEYTESSEDTGSTMTENGSEEGSNGRLERDLQDVMDYSGADSDEVGRKDGSSTTDELNDADVGKGKYNWDSSDSDERNRSGSNGPDISPREGEINTVEKRDKQRGRNERWTKGKAVFIGENELNHPVEYEEGTYSEREKTGKYENIYANSDEDIFSVDTEVANSEKIGHSLDNRKAESAKNDRETPKPQKYDIVMGESPRTIGGDDTDIQALLNELDKTTLNDKDNTEIQEPKISKQIADDQGIGIEAIAPSFRDFIDTDEGKVSGMEKNAPLGDLVTENHTFEREREEEENKVLKDNREIEEPEIGMETANERGMEREAIAPFFRNIMESKAGDMGGNAPHGEKETVTGQPERQMEVQEFLKDNALPRYREPTSDSATPSPRGYLKGYEPGSPREFSKGNKTPSPREHVDGKETLFSRENKSLSPRNNDNERESPPLKEYSEGKKVSDRELANGIEGIDDFHIHGTLATGQSIGDVNEPGLCRNMVDSPTAGTPSSPRDNYVIKADGNDDMYYERSLSKEDNYLPERSFSQISNNDDGDFNASLGNLNKEGNLHYQNVAHSTPDAGSSTLSNNVQGSVESDEVDKHDTDHDYSSSNPSLERHRDTSITDQAREESSRGFPFNRPLSINVDVPPLNLGSLINSPTSPIPAIAVNDDVLPDSDYRDGREMTQENNALHDSGFGEEQQTKVSPGSMENIIEDVSGHREQSDGDDSQHPAGKVHLLKAYLTNTYPDHKALLAMPGLTLPLPDDGRRSPGALSIISVATVDEGTQTDVPFSERDKGVSTQDLQPHDKQDQSELEHLQLERIRIIEALSREQNPYKTSTEEAEAHLNYSMGETHALLEVLDDPWYTDIMLPLFPGESKEIDDKIRQTTKEYVNECRREILPVIAEYEERRLEAEEKQHQLEVEEDHKRAVHRYGTGDSFLDRHRDIPDVRISPVLQRRTLYSETDIPRSPGTQRRTLHSESDVPRSPGSQRRALYSESEIQRILGPQRNTLHSESDVRRSPNLQRKVFLETDIPRSSGLQRNTFADSHIALNRSISLDIPSREYSSSVHHTHSVDQPSKSPNINCHYCTDKATSPRSISSSLEHLSYDKEKLQTSSTSIHVDHTVSTERLNYPRLDRPLSPRPVNPPQYSSLVTNHPTIVKLHEVRQSHDVHPPLSPRGQAIPSQHKENLLSVRRELVNETILSRSPPVSPRPS